MKRGLATIILAVVAFLYAWNHAITQQGIARYVDQHPKLWKADLVLFTLGSFHEVINQDEKSLAMYQRIVKAYPESAHGEEAQFRVASAYERLKNRARALEEYEVYLEKFPEGRFSRSVNINIRLIKGF